MTTTQAPPRRNGRFVEVDGVPTYYESNGTGEPLVLLHGGLCTAESFDPQVATLAEEYQVLVPERFGHGRTPDIDGPITYENMAQHTIGFIEAVGTGPVHLAGWSDGAIVALLVALRRPKLVRKVVVIDQYVSLSGATPHFADLTATLTPDLLPPFLRELYAAVSPDGPDHFTVVFDKLLTIWKAETGIEVSDLTNVAAPTLVLCGDDGAVTLAHLAEVASALPDAQLAIVPGASHGAPMEKPHVVNQLILDFLAEQQVPKLFSFEGAET